MARQHSDERATPVVPAVAEQPRPRVEIGYAAASVDSAIAVGAVGVAVALGLGLGALAALLVPVANGVELGLANLLHGMVAIKALIFAAALGLVMLRLRGRVGGRCLIGYSLGLGMSAAALVWLWGLSGLLIGSMLFYGGLVVTYLTASRDPLLVSAFRRVVPSGRRSRGGGGS